MLPNLLLIGPLRIARRLAVWALFACLAIGLPLQAVSAVMTGILGPRHAHQTVSAPAPSDDPMAGWKDFRRANYEYAAGAIPSAQVLGHAHAHAHTHEGDSRHHHALDDASVIDLDTPADGDGAPAESSPVGAGVVLAANANRLEPPPQLVAAIDDVWRTAAARSFVDPFPRRIERPPSSC